MAKKLHVTQESSTGRNQRFYDPVSHRNMSRPELVRNIESGGKYSKDYHVREVNGVKTPCSNPDGSTGNNLG